MKTIEEKAKAYDEALKAAIAAHKDEDRHLKATLERIFPELQESEDERIRKGLIKALSSIGKRNWGGIDVFESISWLEKQGEQSFAIRWHDVSLIPREMEELLVEWDSNDATWHDVAFYHADSKTFWDGGRRVEDVTRWCYIDDLLEKQSEPKPTDAEMKEILRTEYEKGRADAIAETQVAWSEEDEKMLNRLIGVLDGTNKEDYHEGWEEIFLPWLKSLKDRVGCEANCTTIKEWSEEDKEMLNLIIDIFEVNHPNEYFKANELNDPNMKAVYTEEIVAWLKQRIGG